MFVQDFCIFLAFFAASFKTNNIVYVHFIDFAIIYLFAAVGVWLALLPGHLSTDVKWVFTVAAMYHFLKFILLNGLALSAELKRVYLLALCLITFLITVN